MPFRVIAFGGAIVLILPQMLFAQVVISEIMYDVPGTDTGREWVEIYNEGSEINVTEWKLFEGTTNHGIVALGSEMLPSASYAVIADNPTKFKNDWPSYDGLLFDSAFSLKNTGEELILRCCNKDLSDKDAVTYEPHSASDGEGASLSRSGSTFVVTEPSPGAAPQQWSAPPPKADPEPVAAPAKKLPDPPAPKPKPAPVPQEKSETEPQTKSAVLEADTHADDVNTGADASVSGEVPRPMPLPVPPAAQFAEPAPAPTVNAGDQSNEQTTESTAANRASEASEERESGSREPKALIAAASESIPEEAGQSSSDTLLWWLLAGTLSVAAAGVVVYLQRRTKREWDIIEETE